MEKFDLAVIGGGPGGYVAAIRAASLGLNTAVIEREHLGGICLNWGCIPTKAMLKSAEIFQMMNHAGDFGIKTGKTEFDLKKIVSRSRDISNKLTSGIEALLKKNKVNILNGEAKIESPKLINITSKDRQISIEAKNIIIATGARARILQNFEPDGKQIWTYREALVPKSIPKSMIIVGSGAIGIEFASFYSSFGCNVTVLESAPRILPAEDQEISAIAKKSFESKGIKFYTSVKLLNQNTDAKKVSVSFDHKGKKVTSDSEILLMAVGISANTENLGLDKTKIKLDRGHIITDQFTKTHEPNIYAIGDVAGGPWLAHKASHEGIIAAEYIAGNKPHILNNMSIPACTYSSPQIASLGMSEAEAKKAGINVKIGKFPFYANGKALILGDNNGLIKTVFDAKTGELLGAHMIGSDVTELIQGYVVAKNMEGTEVDLMNTIFPHPTLSEMMHESVMQAYGKQIHI